MISKFASALKLNENQYAVLNNLLFEPVLLSRKEYDDLYSGNLTTFTTSEISELYNRGILIDNENQDAEVEKVIKNHVYSMVKQQGISVIYIIPAASCNLACKYCIIGDMTEYNPESIIISEDVIDLIVERYTAYLNSNNITKAKIIFYGGEPLIAFDQIKYAVNEFQKRTGITFEFTIVTNATLLNTNMVPFLENNHITLGISIDGPQKTNDANRKFKTDTASVYDSVYNAICLLKTSKIKFGLSITLTNEIMDDADFFNWVINLGVKNITYNLMHHTRDGAEWITYYQNATKFLIKSHENLQKHDIMDGRIMRKYDAFYNQHFKYSDCAAVGGNQLSFMPNGDITVCHGCWPLKNHVCGNVHTNSIEDIMETDAFRWWENRLTVNCDACLRCPALRICGGGCPIQSEHLFKNRDSIDYGYCMHTLQFLTHLLSNLDQVS